MKLLINKLSLNKNYFKFMKRRQLEISNIVMFLNLAILFFSAAIEFNIVIIGIVAIVDIIFAISLAIYSKLKVSDKEKK